MTDTLHAAASDLRHVASGGACDPRTLEAHADALLAMTPPPEPSAAPLVARLRELHAATTFALPVRVEGGADPMIRDDAGWWVAQVCSKSDVEMDDDGRANAEFIAALLNAFPALCAALETAQQDEGRLDWLEQHRTAYLNPDFDTDTVSVGTWSGINDRQYDERGTGYTVREALDAARRAAPTPERDHAK